MSIRLYNSYTPAVAQPGPSPVNDQIDRLASMLKVARGVGEQDVPLERLSETLQRVANDYKLLQAQAAALDPDNAVARGLVERAQSAIAEGRLGEARQFLAQARQAQVAAAQEALKLRDKAQATADAQLLGAAASTATEGDVAMTEHLRCWRSRWCLRRGRHYHSRCWIHRWCSDKVHSYQSQYCYPPSLVHSMSQRGLGSQEQRCH